MNSKICDAIKSKSLLKFNYKGGERIVEPFCYGVGGTGKEFLRAWQVSGFSEHPDDIPNWRLFIVDQELEVEMLSDNFDGNRPNYNPDDSVMSEIYANI